MSTLEEDFTAALDSLELPDNDLVDAVMERVTAPSRLQAQRPRFALVAAAIVVTIVGIIAIPPARSAVVDWLGIGATQIEVRPDSLESTSLGDTDSFADLGTRLSLAVGQGVLPDLGPPVGVFDHPIRGRSFVWEASDSLPPLGETPLGAILTLRATTATPLQKSVSAGVGVEPVVIAGPSGPIEGLWIGGEHQLQTGGLVAPYRAQRVLLWVDDGVEYRLESNVDVDVAVDLAASVEGGPELLPPA